MIRISFLYRKRNKQNDAHNLLRNNLHRPPEYLIMSRIIKIKGMAAKGFKNKTGNGHRDLPS